MTWYQRLAAWLGKGIAHIRGLVPFTSEGRSTLIYLIFAGAGPVLTLIVWWALWRAFEEQQWPMAKGLADKIAWGLLIIVSALACYVSIRAIRLGRDGFSVERSDQAVSPSVTTTATVETKVEPSTNDKGN